MREDMIILLIVLLAISVLLLWVVRYEADTAVCNTSLPTASTFSDAELGGTIQCRLP